MYETVKIDAPIQTRGRPVDFESCSISASSRVGADDELAAGAGAAADVDADADPGAGAGADPSACADEAHVRSARHEPIAFVVSLELHMDPRADDVHGSPIRVVRGIANELVVERRPGRGPEAQAVEGLEHALRRLPQAAVPDERID